MGSCDAGAGKAPVPQTIALSTLAAISRDFIDRWEADLDGCITDALRVIGELAGADRAWVFTTRPNFDFVDNTHEWCRDPSHTRIARLQAVPLSAIPQVIGALTALVPFVLDIENGDDALRAEAELLESSRTPTSLIAPMVVGGLLVGCVGLESIDHRVEWSETVATLLDHFATMLVTAIGRRDADVARRRTESLLHGLVTGSPDVFVVLDHDGALTYVSPAVERVLGARPEEWLGDPVADHLHPDDRDRVVAALGEYMREGITATDPVEVRVRHRDGSYVACEAIGHNLVEDGEVRGIVINVRDITERKQFEERLAFEATHDGLTGLPLRKPLLEHLERTLATSERRGDNVAVLFVDLDHFKRVNDTLGHAAGDELLKAFAGRLSNAVRTMDMAARLGGDEFVVVCPLLSDSRQVVVVAQRILALVERPFTVRGVEVYVGASIGIAVAEAGVDAATLLSHADTAAYRAKDRGRNRYEIFDDELRAAVAYRLETETALRRSIERGEIVLHYQPVIDAGSGAVTAFEGLARWARPGFGLVAPGDFLSIAEETGLIVPLGRSVLDQALRQYAAWRDEFGDECPGVAVNLSMRQLVNASFLDETRAAIDASGVHPGKLTLEITESTVMRDAASTIGILEALRELGVRLAIDDFGTGYSSLSYLRRLPVHTIKIDRSFVLELGLDRHGSTIVAAVINLAHALGMDVVAEGVGNIEHVAALVSLGCDRMQGFYFSPPVPVDEATEMLRGPTERFEATA